MKSGDRVIWNTIILYGKMVVSIVVGLVITRLTLNSLGVEDYGIYNLVAGLVSMLSVLNASMAAATQRYLSYNLDREDSNTQYSVFNTSVLLHLLFAIVIISIIEIAGGYFIKNVLTISPAKIGVSMSVLHLLSVSILFAILAVPYTSVFISRENMLMLSLIEIGEMMSKLLGVFMLLKTDGNKLIFYSTVIAAASALSFIAKLIVSRIKYREARVKIAYMRDTKLIREMSLFAGWYTFATVGSIGRNQGIAMVLNVFFGVIVNAAYGITNQVNGLVQFFATAMMQSIRPQIIKSEGNGDRQKVIRLSLIACKYMYFLSAIVALPMLFEMEFVLKVWLNNPPEYCAGFCRLVLVSTLFLMLTVGLGAAIDATGKIKRMYIIIGILHILNIPLGYLLLHLGGSPYSILWLVAAEEIACLLVRVNVAHRVAGLPYSMFINKVIVPAAIVSFTTILVGGLIRMFSDYGTTRFVTTIVACFLTAAAGIWLFGTERDERQLFRGIFCKLLCI